MHNQNRIYRVFQLIQLLRTQPTKSPKEISAILSITERSVYRYFDLLQELGFNLVKAEAGRYSLSTFSDDAIYFTVQERKYLNKMLLTTGRTNTLAKAIAAKIDGFTEVELLGRSLYDANVSKTIDLLSLAIQRQRQVKLQNYYSISCGSISTRIVEPVKFTSEYKYLSAYELETESNKYFALDRISSVEVLDSPTRYNEQHEFFSPDIFGFQGRDMNKEIELNLSLKAAVLLKEEFPMSRSFIVPEKNSNRYYFKAPVQSFTGPTRFILGLFEDVEVLGSDDFKKHLEVVFAKLKERWS